MQCPMCKEEISNDATVCPACETPLQKTSENLSSDDLLMIIDGLKVSEQRKETFRLIHKYNLLSSHGWLKLWEARKMGISFKERWHMYSLLAFFFTWIYYCVCGMWKKGLSFLALSILFLVINAQLFGESETAGYSWMVVINLAAAMMAIGDQYRSKVLKEDFWF